MTALVLKCVRTLCATALLALVAPAAMASPPGDAETLEVQHMLGYDGIVPVALERLKKDEKLLAGFPAEDRECVIGQFGPMLETRLLGAMKVVFQSHEYVEAWLQFGKTPAGSKAMALIREKLGAVIRGETESDGAVAEIMSKFSEAELSELAAFTSSPAGMVFNGGNLPDLGAEPSAEEMKLVQAKVQEVCYAPRKES
jgi:hypothetical protein